MKAAVVRSFDQPLVIEDVPVPEPGPEQVLVRIESCGLCHAARGEWPVRPVPPSIPGHEGVGIVERVGSGNDHGLSTGMRVALPWLGYSCGDCGYCNSGRETLCERQLDMGYSRSSSLVAVFGVGGLGHLAVQYARITGAEVVAVDISPERLETALALGADHVVHAGEEDPVAAIKRLGGATQAIATAVNPKAFEQALGSLARGGRLVCVGLPADNDMKLPIFETVLGGLTVTGSIVGTHQDAVEVFDLQRRGKTRVERREVSLEDVNDAIEAVVDGTAGAARTVFRMMPVEFPSAGHQALAAV